MTLAAVQAMTFDVFGTVVDWRGSIIREGQSFGQTRGIEIDWARFADEWRAGYQPAMDKVRRGEIGWVKLDGLHRLLLDDLLVKFGIEGLDEAEVDHLNGVWHRLQPWPDAIEGLQRLRQKHIIAPLSNGNMALLTNMVKHAGLPWDCIFSAELAQRYKPDAAVYQMASELLSLPPEQVMMVAAHEGDLRAARSVGMRTAFVHRPLEFGPDSTTDQPGDSEADMVATDFVDLAAQMGC